MVLAGFISAALICATVQAPAASSQQRQASLLDVLVEAQSLYTLANARAATSVSEAIDLTRRAQMLASDAELRRQGWDPRNSRPDDVGNLSALRARLADLAGNLNGRFTSLLERYRSIQALLKDRRVSAAVDALSRLPPDTPTADAKLPFADLRETADKLQQQVDDYVNAARAAEASGSPSELSQAIEWLTSAQLIDRDQDFSSEIRDINIRMKHHPTTHHGLLIGGLVVAGFMAGAGLAIDQQIQKNEILLDATDPRDVVGWNTLYDDTQRLTSMRNGCYGVAIGVGIMAVAVSAVKGMHQVGLNSGARSPKGTKREGEWQVSLNPLRPMVQYSLHF